MIIFFQWIILWETGYRPIISGSVLKSNSALHCFYDGINIFVLLNATNRGTATRIQIAMDIIAIF